MVQEHRTALKGRVTRYIDAGLGEPLILLHAFPLSADMWRPQLERVPQGWRFIAPDLRGLGGSGLDGATDASMNDYASDTLDLMNELDLERAVIGGLSMGGYVAFAIFRQAPERFSGMILADTKSAADSDEAVHGRRALLDLVRSQGVHAVADHMIGKLLGDTSRRERPELVADVRRLIEANPPGGVDAAIYALMNRPDSTPDLARIGCPTLVMVGEEDAVTPIGEAESLHRSIRGSQLATLPAAGHLSNLEAPEEFSNTIAGWVASLQ
jgi:pimeloyl-ACP methyl ester carboxylesterase